MKHMKIIALLLAGSFFLGGCAGGTVKRGVTVNGIEVGGMHYLAAAEKIRQDLARPPLSVSCPDGAYTAPLDYSDDLEEQLRRAKRGASLSVMVRREYVNMEEELAALCAENARGGRPAELTFSASFLISSKDILLSPFSPSARPFLEFFQEISS